MNFEINKENQKEEIMYDLMDNKLVQYNTNVLVSQMVLIIKIEHIQYTMVIHLLKKYSKVNYNGQHILEFDLIH